MKFFKSITFRLTRWYLETIVIVLLAFGAVAFSMLYVNLHQNLDDSLRLRATQLRSSIKMEAGKISLDEQLSEVVLLYSPEGVLLERFGPPVEIEDADKLVREVSWGKSSFLTTETDDKQEIRLYGEMLFSRDTRVTIIVGRPTTDINEMLETFGYILATSGLAVVLIVGISSLTLAHRVMKPVVQITKAAQEISEKDLSRRIAVRTEDELGRLAQTLNHMIERIAGSLDRQRQFTADASHELRTPLSIIQAESTLALSKERNLTEYQKSLELVTQEADHMSHIINKLLFLARSEAGKEPLNLETVSLKELFANLAVDIEVLCRDKGLICNLGPFDDLFVKGDKVKLKQLFLNLWDNAIRHTPSGGSVSSLAIKNGKTVTVTVADTGTGIAPEHLPRIFERFYRVDKARSRAEGGAGLGLAIAKHIAEVHDGNIQIESQLGKGTTFFVTLLLVQEK